MGLSQIIKIIGKYILLCNYFALGRIESIFAIEVPWYDRHQSLTSLLCQLGCHGNQSETSITYSVLSRIEFTFGKEVPWDERH